MGDGFKGRRKSPHRGLGLIKQNYMPCIGFFSTQVKTTTRLRGSTHVAVAANISCLFAFVHTLSAAAKSSVKTMIRQIFNALCPETK